MKNPVYTGWLKVRRSQLFVPCVKFPEERVKT